MLWSNSRELRLLKFAARHSAQPDGSTVLGTILALTNLGLIAEKRIGKEWIFQLTPVGWLAMATELHLADYLDECVRVARDEAEAEHLSLLQPRAAANRTHVTSD